MTPPKKAKHKARNPPPLTEEHDDCKHNTETAETSTSAVSAPPAKKPKITADGITSSDLFSRLNAFMPAMQAANEDLEAEIADGTVSQRYIEINDEEPEESYIEMNLGLGVLEERRLGDDSENGEDEGSGKGGNAEEDDEDENKDILLKLLNSSKRHGKGPRGRPSIEEVEHSADTPTPEKQRENKIEKTEE